MMKRLFSVALDTICKEISHLIQSRIREQMISRSLPPSYGRGLMQDLHCDNGIILYLEELCPSAIQ